MSLRLFMDEHIKSAVTNGLRKRGFDVLTAQDDGSDGLSDAQHLDRATFLGRVFVTQDEDLLAEGARRQSAGVVFMGIIYGHQMDLTIGQMISELELVAYCLEQSEIRDQIYYIPLR
jgi:predicted nuclease of predicted toxin-antitoxin system